MSRSLLPSRRGLGGGGGGGRRAGRLLARVFERARGSPGVQGRGRARRRAPAAPGLSSFQGWRARGGREGRGPGPPGPRRLGERLAGGGRPAKSVLCHADAIGPRARAEAAKHSRVVRAALPVGRGRRGGRIGVRFRPRRDASNTLERAARACERVAAAAQEPAQRPACIQKSNACACDAFGSCRGPLGPAGPAAEIRRTCLTRRACLGGGCYAQTASLSSTCRRRAPLARRRPSSEAARGPRVAAACLLRV